MRLVLDENKIFNNIIGIYNQNEGNKIMISACVLIRTGSGKFDEVVNAMRQFNDVRDLYTTLGRYDVVIDLECEDFTTLSSTIIRMSRIAGVVFTETLVELPLQGR